MYQQKNAKKIEQNRYIAIICSLHQFNFICILRRFYKLVIMQWHERLFLIKFASLYFNLTRNYKITIMVMPVATITNIFYENV